MNNLDTTISYLSGKDVTIDCNVFLLLLIGGLGEKHITSFKRTNIFDNSDYLLLIKLINRSNVILTPNVLTESSNLIRTYDDSIGNKASIELKRIIASTKEIFIHSTLLTQNKCFLKFGLTDSSIYNLASKGVTAITVDAPLYGLLYNKGYPVINFNHVRFK